MFALKNLIKLPLRALKQRIVYLGNEMCANIDVSVKNALAYNVLRDLNVAHKDKLLVALYPKFGRNIAYSQNLANIKQFLALTRPVCVPNLVRIGGTNDGGYVMINPQIDLLNPQNLAIINAESNLKFVDSASDSANLSQIPPPKFVYKAN